MRHVPGFDPGCGPYNSSVILSEAPVLSLSKERICFSWRSVFEREILHFVQNDKVGVQNDNDGVAGSFILSTND